MACCVPSHSLAARLRINGCWRQLCSSAITHTSENIIHSAIMPYPLTTIFTPASSCFSDGPTFGENCGAATQVAYQSVSCFWSRPVNCWPPNPSILGAPSSQVSSVIFGDDVAGIAYEYSPGVLPTGWWAIGTSSITPSSSISTKIGCPV